jgi:putative spermidine/putrescine transport system substrate-binding protein
MTNRPIAPPSLLNRRSLLKTGAAALAAPFVWTGRSFGAEQITASDVGGAPAAAIRKAFYDPFEKATGIQVVGVAHEADPTTQFKLLVDTKSYIWDVSMVTLGHVGYLSTPKDYLEPLNITPPPGTELVPGTLTPVWFGFSVFSTILAYRTDKFGQNGPANWADYWNVEKFPGRRGLYKGVAGTLEAALMADGVAGPGLYPLDVDRAYKMLDKIKSHISVWWTSGAQNTQILQSGEVDMSDTWSARAFAAIDAGAPVQMVWNQGLYATDGWSIPKGTPRADLARKFVLYCMNPEQQAAYSSIVANGPTNEKAYDFLTPQRAKLLPTAPANIKNLQLTNEAWWAKNRAKQYERFQEWLLS